MDEKKTAPAQETQEQPITDGSCKNEPVALGPGALIVLNAR